MDDWIKEIEILKNFEYVISLSLHLFWIEVQSHIAANDDSWKIKKADPWAKGVYNFEAEIARAPSIELTFLRIK